MDKTVLQKGDYVKISVITTAKGLQKYKRIVQRITQQDLHIKHKCPVFASSQTLHLFSTLRQITVTSFKKNIEQAVKSHVTSHTLPMVLKVP